ncbi:MAG: hypothetical protein H6Q89_867, partial [Myxococcaceae bacterium]|nr:hypothetical protein [Myxococcaceae bacterium]
GGCTLRRTARGLELDTPGSGEPIALELTPGP